MNDIGYILIWFGIWLTIIGLFLTFLIVRTWWRDHIHKDPPKPDPVMFREERISLRRDK